MGAATTTLEMDGALSNFAIEFPTNPTVPSAMEEQRPRTKRLRSLTRPLPPRPSRPELERACRIALMEAQQPASVEVIYERIVRRGSLQLFGYKRPFRAIGSAM